MNGYISSPQRMRRLCVNERVEATAAALPRYRGLEGIIIATRRREFGAEPHRVTALVDWYRYEPLSSEFAMVYSAHKHRAEELKLVDGEVWDPARAYPLPATD